MSGPLNQKYRRTSGGIFSAGAGCGGLSGAGPLRQGKRAGYPALFAYSVYARVCNGYDAVATHERRLKQNLPANGSVRLLVITERQYESIQILLRERRQADTPVAYEQLTLL